MTFRSPADAVLAHKTQTTFTRYEASSILANVLPNSDMDASETAQLQERQRFFDDLAENRRAFTAAGGTDELFDKLVA